MDWRKIVRTIGEDLLGVTVSDSRKAFAICSTVLLAGITIVIGGVVIVSGTPAIGWSFVFLIPTIFVLMILYFIGMSVFTMFIHWLGKRFVKFSNYYPRWIYSPKFDYHFELGLDKGLKLYIKSFPKNKKAFLRLEFQRAHLLKGTEGQKHMIDVSSSNQKGCILYNKEIESTAQMVADISTIAKDGTWMLFFPGNFLGIGLFPGEYLYEFSESGTDKGVNFDRKTIKLGFTFNEEGEFEV